MSENKLSRKALTEALACFDGNAGWTLSKRPRLVTGDGFLSSRLGVLREAWNVAAYMRGAAVGFARSPL